MAGEQQPKDPRKKLQPEAEPESLEDQLDGLEHKVDRLKVLYDQYFMAIEKVEPLVARKEVNRIIQNLAKIQIRNTGLRFRYRTLVQRFNVHITYWNRILREIELGTYKRDVLRASRAMAAKGAELPEEIAAKLNPRDRAKLRAAAEAGVAERRPDEPAGGEVLEMEADEPSAPRVLELEADEPSAPHVLEMEADEPPAPPPPRPTPAPRPPTPAAGAPAARPPTPVAGAPAARPPTPVAGAPAARPPTPVAGAPAARPPTPLGTPAARPATPLAVARITPVARPATPAAGTARPPTPMGTAPVGAPARAGGGAGGMSRAQVDVLYRKLMHAKKLCGEPTGGLTPDSLAATIEKTAPKVMQEKGCREVEFTVVIKNDKAVLKAIPKK